MIPVHLHLGTCKLGAHQLQHKDQGPFLNLGRCAECSIQRVELGLVSGTEVLDVPPILLVFDVVFLMVVVVVVVVVVEVVVVAEVEMRKLVETVVEVVNSVVDVEVVVELSVQIVVYDTEKLDCSTAVAVA